MELNYSFCIYSAILSSFLLMGFTPASASPSTFMSDRIFESQASIGRNLLQAKKGCPENFEFKNYTIITSQCKGPHYAAAPCCAAFKEFACPYVELLNDVTNDCASTMFSYINLYGKYPPGLFASECREGKQGLECPATGPTSVSKTSVANDTSRSEFFCYPFLFQLVAAGVLAFLFQLL